MNEIFINELRKMRFQLEKKGLLHLLEILDVPQKF